MARKNNSLELEFLNNDTQKKWLEGSSYLDFVLDPSAKYVV